MFFCFVIGFAASGYGQAPQVPVPAEPATPGMVVRLWPGTSMPGKGAAKPEGSHTPAPTGLLRKVTDVSEPALEVFKPQGAGTEAGGAVPAIVICPGGGYGSLSYNIEGTEIANWLNSLGMTGIVLKYRVPQNREGAFQDIQRAVRLVRAHAKEWGVLPDKLGVMGFSAGGHLSARLSNNFDKAAYEALDAADKESCRPDFVVLVYPAYLEQDEKKAGKKGLLAPEMKVPVGTPPTLIVHTVDDPFWEAGSKIYDAALTAGNVPHEFLLYPTGGHGFSLHCDKAAQVWPLDAARWLRKMGIIPRK